MGNPRLDPEDMKKVEISFINNSYGYFKTTIFYDDLYGSMDWETLVNPSFLLAKYGFSLDPQTVSYLNSSRYKNKLSNDDGRLSASRAIASILTRALFVYIPV